MAYVVQDAPDCLVIDASEAVNAEFARALAQTKLLGLRVQGVGQYIGLHEGNGPNDLTPARLAGILDAGLGCFAIQHCYNPGWQACGELGDELGGRALRNAILAGYGEGAAVWLDLEGCASVGQPVTDFCNAWANQVKSSFTPRLYVGFACGLSPVELYETLPDFHGYGSDVGPREVAERGFQWKQHAETVLHLGNAGDLRVDPGTVRADLKGGRMPWMIAA